MKSYSNSNKDKTNMFNNNKNSLSHNYNNQIQINNFIVKDKLQSIPPNQNSLEEIMPGLNVIPDLKEYDFSKPLFLPNNFLNAQAKEDFLIALEKKITKNLVSHGTDFNYYCIMYINVLKNELLLVNKTLVTLSEIVENYSKIFINKKKTIIRPSLIEAKKELEKNISNESIFNEKTIKYLTEKGLLTKSLESIEPSISKVLDLIILEMLESTSILEKIYKSEKVDLEIPHIKPNTISDGDIVNYGAINYELPEKKKARRL